MSSVSIMFTEINHTHRGYALWLDNHASTALISEPHTLHNLSHESRNQGG